jgi:hypothetical protein
VQTSDELQERQTDGQGVQLLVFDRKLDIPQLVQTEGLLVEQVAQLEKHLVQLLVKTIFKYPGLHPLSSHSPSPALPHVIQFAAHFLQSPFIGE